MNKIYISGTIKGHTNGNIKAFKNAQIKLEGENYLVTNPFEITPDTELTYEEYMSYDIRALTFCDSIYMLKGWEQSKGANIEFNVAKAIGLKIIYE